MSPAASTLLERMRSRVSALSGDQVLQGVILIGGGLVSQDQRMVRALLLDEYEKRNGEEALDALLVTLGMA